jgi:NHL repeat
MGKGLGGRVGRDAIRRATATKGRRATIAAVVIIGTVIVTAAELPPGRQAPPAPARLTAINDSYAHASGAKTVAGTGIPGFDGDGKPGADSELNAPTGIVEDASGDLFIADSGNCRVREIPAATGMSFGRRVHGGDIVTIAGGSCRDASDHAPSALAVDSAGDLFIAFGPGALVDELPARNTTAFGRSMTTGKLTVIAGTGVPGYNGDGRRATRSTLDDPTGVAVDAAGDVLISDTANCRLRLVAAAGGTRFGVTLVGGDIYTVAGNGICGSTGDDGPALQAELWDPGALTVDGAGDVLVADQGNRSIRELAVRSGTFFGVAIAADHLGTIAGEGSYGPFLTDGLSAVGEVGELNFPTAIALDGEGNLYIADGAMHAIRLVAATTTTLLGKTVRPDDMYIVAGALSTGPQSQRTTWIQTRMLDPTGLVVAPGDELIYSDGGADVVRELPAHT